MDPLEEKLNGIFAEWDREDEEEAADDLESGADAMALADPATWAAHDLENAPAQGPMPEAPEMEGAEPLPDDEPVRLRATPPAPPKAPKDMDWVELQQALQNGEMRSASSKAFSPIFANAGESGAYRTALQNAQMRASSSRNAEHMFENIAPGYKTDPGRFDKQSAVAREPLEIDRARQTRDARQSAIEQQRRASNIKDALDDPNSMQSQQARNAWKSWGLKTFVGFDNASANDLKRLVGGAGAARAADNAAADDAYRTTKDAEKAAADARRLEEQIRYHKALEAAKSKPKGPHPVVAVKAGDLSTVPEQYRDLVRGIAEGRMEAPKASSRFGADVLKYVVAYKPDFDATRFGNYAAVAKQQATGKDAVAIDVGLEHLKTARRLIPKNASPQFINRLKQAVASGTGDAEFRPFIAAATVAAHELAKIYNVEDQEGKREVLHQLSSVQSPEQLEAVFNTFVELVEGKQHGLQRQRERVAPTGGTPTTAGHSGKKTPGGKPYATKQVNKKTGATRYLDAAGAVVEETNG